MFSHASDHLPLILQSGTDKRFRGRVARGFNFEEAWLLWDGCEVVIGEAWAKTRGGGSSLPNTSNRIESYGANLQAWGSSKTHPQIAKNKRMQKLLEVLNSSDPTKANIGEFLAASKQLEDLLLK